MNLQFKQTKDKTKSKILELKFEPHKTKSKILELKFESHKFVQKDSEVDYFLVGLVSFFQGFFVALIKWYYVEYFIYFMCLVCDFSSEAQGPSHVRHAQVSCQERRMDLAPYLSLRVPQPVQRRG
jgi:hypothetical protein